MEQPLSGPCKVQARDGEMPQVTTGLTTTLLRKLKDHLQWR